MHSDFAYMRHLQPCISRLAAFPATQVVLFRSTYVSDILSIFISYFCTVKRKCPSPPEAKLSKGIIIIISIKNNHRRLVPLLKKICTDTILDRKNIPFSQSRTSSTESQNCYDTRELYSILSTPSPQRKAMFIFKNPLFSLDFWTII